MTNLTLTVDEDILKMARIRALELGTSVNALVREYLRQLAGRSAAAEGVAEFFAATKGAGAGSGPEGRSWTRDVRLTLKSTAIGRLRPLPGSG